MDQTLQKSKHSARSQETQVYSVQSDSCVSSGKSPNLSGLAFPVFRVN